MDESPHLLTKLKWSLPWLTRYPLWRLRETFRRLILESGPKHFIFVVANHFEPGWDGSGIALDWRTQISRVEDWCEQARSLGNAFRDCDRVPFRHTYFYPIEQYHPTLLDKLTELQQDGFGDVEIHLHHGIEEPDTAMNLRRTLQDFRDILAGEHRLLSTMGRGGAPMYAFVHGNSALANSCGGRFCGVNSEFEVLAETGCYADLTFPSWPDETQMGHINAIYQCGRPLNERSPHAHGLDLCVGERPNLPILITGPLVFDWRRRIHGLPIPRVDGGALASNYLPDIERFSRWRSTGISVKGRPEWVFIKLYCHGFFPSEHETLLGDPMRRLLDGLLEMAGKDEPCSVRFATAREAFNIIMAAVDGQQGDPALYRDYLLRSIMQAGVSYSAGHIQAASAV
jgi:hypothetical protein